MPTLSSSKCSYDSVGDFSVFIVWCQKIGQRTSLKFLWAKKREHISLSSKNKRTLGMGAMNLLSDSSSACDGYCLQDFTATCKCKLPSWDCSARNL